MKHLRAVHLGTLAREGLAGEEEQNAESVPSRAVRAIHYYLGDRDADRPGWKYPAFIRGEDGRAEVEVELSVEDELWGALEREARAQGVSAERLVEHAALYFAAEVNSGRATVRILDGLGDDA